MYAKKIYMQNLFHFAPKMDKFWFFATGEICLEIESLFLLHPLCLQDHV